MKKITALFLCLTLLASLCACSVQIRELPEITTEEPEPTSSLTTVTRTQEYKDSNGRVVYVIDAQLPCLSGEGDLINAVNASLAEIFDKYSKLAASNIENVSDFMDARESDKPWSIKIRYTEKYVGEDYVSVFYSVYRSSYGPDSQFPSESHEACTVSMKTSERLSLLHFAVEDSETARDKLIEKICEMAKRNFYTDGSITESQLQAVADTFDAWSYWYADGTVSYFFARNQIVPGETGDYVCKLKPSDYAGILDFSLQ